MRDLKQEYSEITEGSHAGISPRGLRSALDSDSNLGGSGCGAPSRRWVLRNFLSVWHTRIVQECPDLGPVDSKIHILRYVSGKLSNFHGVQFGDDYPNDMATRIE